MVALVVYNGVVVPVDPPGVVHDPGWVRVEGNRIKAIGAGAARNSTAGDESIDAHGGLILPGLISAHQHVLDILLRGGVPVGPSFLDWLLGLYYAGMAEFRPEDAGVATALGRDGNCPGRGHVRRRQLGRVRRRQRRADRRVCRRVPVGV